MASRGTYQLNLFDTSEVRVAGPARLRFRLAKGDRIVAQVEPVLDPTKPGTYRFDLPAIPDVASPLYAEIRVDRFRGRWGPFFVLRQGQLLQSDPLYLLRKPKEWSAAFTAWDDLAPSFQDLRDLLGRSPDLRVQGRLEPLAGLWTGSAYDADPDPPTALAKASLLNLARKLADVAAPTQPPQPWLAYLVRLLAIGRERLVAVVDPAMERLVRKLAVTGAHPDYNRSPAGEHHKNFPAEFAVRKKSLIAVKTDESKANLQLTVGLGTDPASGTEVALLDADLDEHGQILKHLVDVLILHPITGGTHPHDIHDILQLVAGTEPIDPGYRLV